MQAFQLLAIVAGRNGEIDACGLDGGVTEKICQPRDVAAFFIEYCGKEMAQVVGKDFGRGDTGNARKALEATPDALAREWFPTGRKKERALRSFACAGEGKELLAELGRDEDGADFSFEANVSAACSGCIHRNGAELAHADACGAEGFDDEGELGPAQAAGSAQELVVVAHGESAVAIAKKAALHTQIVHAQLVPATKVEIAVEGSEHAVDGGRGIACAK